MRCGGRPDSHRRFSLPVYGGDWFAYDFDPALAAVPAPRSIRSPRGQIAGNYLQQFWRSRRRSEAQQHRVVHHPDGGLSVPSMPVTAEALLRHAEKFGWDGVKEVARWEGIELERGTPRRNEKRIRGVQRLFEEHLSFDEIASRTGLSLQTVRKYLREPKKPMEESGFKQRSTASNSKIKGDPWGTPRKRLLGERIVALRKDGMVPLAIADRLRKSDVVVRRYLREAEAAGLLAESA
jgi:hypothetical protein